MSVEGGHGESIVSAVVGVIGGGVLRDVFRFVVGGKRREEDAITKHVDSLAKQLKASDERMDRFESQLDDCRAKHEQCEDGRHKDREAHRSEIAALKALIPGAIPLPDPASRRGPSRRRGG